MDLQTVFSDWMGYDFEPFNESVAIEMLGDLLQTQSEISSETKENAERPEWKRSAKPGSKCPICERSFARNYDMRRHVKQTHEKIKPFVCNFCQRTFARHAHLRSHTANRHNPQQQGRWSR
eukprot:Plantae.Rhodophyta-Purpureofilum_apyrenoidigerum.ctg37329.p2 GENE.Plantae.Rhodophyta-Purpureofilum_apyrenoidigerum.ctg37329~~Plantae.Rhodophyta-Purpureofilum_apyrenoidigerum.ctg37329.p2  ORF type:complete len:121 (+),score=14.94 Plantae.Rhodophyta-Purpureofilum_apyrenoidigerum.ctg37329:81-443(+)